MRGGGCDMVRPIDLKDDDLWKLMQAASAGDEDEVKALVQRRPELASSEYDYTPAMHFAVREGHLNILRFLLEHGADPNYRSHPFQDSMLTMAQDREHHDVADFLRDEAARKFPLAEGLAAFLAAARRGDAEHVSKELARDASLARA